MKKANQKKETTQRRRIEQRLEAAVARALREYREVFRRLAAHDRA